MKAGTARRNFFQQMLVRSLDNARERLYDTKDFGADQRDRVKTALDATHKVKMTPGVWDQTRHLVVDASPRMEQGGYWDQWLDYLDVIHWQSFTIITVIVIAY